MSCLHTLFWNPYSIGGLLILSLYFHYKTKFRVFRCFGKTIQSLVSKESLSTSQIQIMATSLGAVMGIGNIVGVATALISGGPGAIFWMAISSIVISSLKYVEIFLACRFRKHGRNGYHGGTHVYIVEGLGRRGVSTLYVLLLVVSALTMGNMIVSNTLASMLHETVGLPMNWCGAILMIVFGLIISRGQRGVMVVSSYLVPYMIMLYLVVCCGIIIFNFSVFIESMKVIIHEAFVLQSMVGGGLGVALKFGVARGIFSNEAGMGSCTMVHAKSDTTPHDEAMLGVFEVFLDSIVMCSLSGVVLVMSGVPTSLSNALLFLLEGFGVFLGELGTPFVVVSLVFFGVTSIMGWYVFGMECIGELRNGFKGGYTILFLFFIFMGSFSELFFIFSISDCLNALMIGINVYACVCLVNYLK